MLKWLELAKQMSHIEMHYLIISKTLKSCCMHSIRLLGVKCYCKWRALQWRQVTWWRQYRERRVWSRSPQQANRASRVIATRANKICINIYLYNSIYYINHCASLVEYLSSSLVLLVNETVREDVQEAHRDEDVFTLNTRFSGSTVRAKDVEAPRHGGLVHPRQDW